MGKRRWQPLWERLHRISLSGMNIGDFDSVAHSGERAVLKHVDQSLGHPDPVNLFDVGANRGEYTRLALEQFGARGCYYCFEPSLVVFQTLTQATSGLPVHLFNLGFGARNEERVLYSDPADSGMSSLYPRRLYIDDGRLLKPSETIRLERLDDFCKRRGITHIHMLKLDVEGHEYSVLEGSSALLDARAIDFIQFEFGAPAVAARVFFRDFYELLCTNYGYQLFRVVRDGLYPVSSYLETREVFFLANYLAARTR
jgi:FkbM family methyltransferase